VQIGGFKTIPDSGTLSKYHKFNGTSGKIEPELRSGYRLLDSGCMLSPYFNFAVHA
jgi:hypothetical protein